MLARCRTQATHLPDTILTSGAVIDSSVLPLHLCFPTGANPSHFCLVYPPTDRLRQPTPLHSTDIYHAYAAQVSALFHPVRTLDPNHNRTTPTSTTHIHLLRHPTKSVSAVRNVLVTAAMRAHLPPKLQETQLRVRSDAFHIGDRCVKRGVTKGICDLCYCLLGQRTPETLRHILLECPFTKPVITTVWRSIVLARTQPQLHSTCAPLSTNEFIEGMERRILFGVPDFDPEPSTPPKGLYTPIAVLSAATNYCLIRRRNRNALCPHLPLKYEPNISVADIFAQVTETATALRTIAEREENRIYTHYEGWLPDETPTNAWVAQWCSTGLMHNTRPRVQLQSPLPSTTPADAEQLPPLQLDAAPVTDRIRARSLQTRP